MYRLLNAFIAAVLIMLGLGTLILIVGVMLTHIFTTLVLIVFCIIWLGLYFSNIDL